jgi:hypothetical protein
MKFLLTLRGIVSGMAVVMTLSHCNSDASDSGSCNELAVQVDQQRQQLQADADRTCSTDEDCVVADYQLSCVDSCRSVPAAVALTAEAALRAAVQASEDSICGDFAERGCQPEVSPCVPAPSSPVAACIEGKCALSNSD